MSAERKDHNITGVTAVDYLSLLHYSAMMLPVGSNAREIFADLVNTKFNKEHCHRRMATALHLDRSALNTVEDGGKEFIIQLKGGLDPETETIFFTSHFTGESAVFFLNLLRPMALELPDEVREQYAGSIEHSLDEVRFSRINGLGTEMIRFLRKSSRLDII